eukprot:UN12987
MSPFIPHIRFTLMENSFFVQNVYTSNILDMKHALHISLYMMDPTLEINEINAIYIQNIKQRIKVVYYHKHNMKAYKKSNVLQYKLEMSSIGTESMGTPYQDLTNNDVMRRVATIGGTNNEFIMAKFDKKKFISRMDISAGLLIFEKMDISADCKDNAFFSNDTSKVQWKNDSNHWIDWKSLKDLTLTSDGKIKTIYDMDIHTSAIRIFDDSKKNISIA